MTARHPDATKLRRLAAIRAASARAAQAPTIAHDAASLIRQFADHLAHDGYLDTLSPFDVLRRMDGWYPPGEPTPTALAEAVVVALCGTERAFARSVPDQRRRVLAMARAVLATFTVNPSAVGDIDPDALAEVLAAQRTLSAAKAGPRAA